MGEEKVGRGRGVGEGERVGRRKGRGGRCEQRRGGSLGMGLACAVRGVVVLQCVLFTRSRMTMLVTCVGTAVDSVLVTCVSTTVDIANECAGYLCWYSS